MGLEGTRPQMSGQLELPLGDRGEAPKRQRSEEVPTAAGENRKLRRERSDGTGGTTREPAERTEACQEQQRESGGRRDDGG